MMIRPRQDFSLSRFSKILYALWDSQTPHGTTLIIDPNTKKAEIRITLPAVISEEEIRSIISAIAGATDCNEKDFKIIGRCNDDL